MGRLAGSNGGTGYGAVLFVEEMLRSKGLTIDGKRVVVSGSGNVATYAIAKPQQLGGQVVACSDSSGYVVDEAGIDLDLLRQVKEVERSRISNHADRRSSAQYVPEGSIWDVGAEVALPCATQNELDETQALSLVRSGLLAVAEGANMPPTPAAVRVLNQAGVLFGPGKAANAGGVATSALEMQQNASRDAWTEDYTEQRLTEIRVAIHQRCRGRLPRSAAGQATTWPGPTSQGNPPDDPWGQNT